LTCGASKNVNEAIEQALKRYNKPTKRNVRLSLYRKRKAHQANWHELAPSQKPRADAGLAEKNVPTERISQRLDLASWHKPSVRDADVRS